MWSLWFFSRSYFHSLSQIKLIVTNLHRHYSSYCGWRDVASDRGQWRPFWIYVSFFISPLFHFLYELIDFHFIFLHFLYSLMEEKILIIVHHSQWSHNHNTKYDFVHILWLHSSYLVPNDTNRINYNGFNSLSLLHVTSRGSHRSDLASEVIN